MPDYFRDAAEAAEFDAGKMHKVNLFSTPRLFCDVYCLLPGQGQKVHSHAANDKIYHVLTGTVTIQVGEEIRSLGPGQTAHAPAGVDHGAHNESSGPATLLVTMAPNPGPKHAPAA
jgi:quercetin dioxygenase-like cupin family protein